MPFIRPALVGCLVLAVSAHLSAEDAQVTAAFGARVFAENCTRCHEPPAPTTRDASAWRAISLHMRVFADLSRQDQQRVFAFLQAASAMPKKD